jgi:hypothetical protein
MRVKDRLKRIVVVVVIFAQVVLFTSSVERNQIEVARASVAAPCGNGADGAGGTLGGPVNTYWSQASVLGTLAAASNTVTLGTIDATGGGAATGVKAGDELLIIQMQDGAFTDTNSSSYGDGATGSGYTSLSSAGLYEYVRVDASVVGTKTTGSIAIDGSGAGFGLVNAYHEAAATGSAGIETYQIIRVPQYTTATLGGNFTAAYWDGATGGVAVLDIASTLNLGGAVIYATADGFRGGGFTVAGGSPAGWSSGDYAESSSTQTPPADGSKGEGIMGTPNYKFQWTNFAAPGAPVGPTVYIAGANGYPGGDQARGAPGNAGGGGTDDDPPANDENTGGGGGAGGGGGGNGGYPWSPQYTYGPAPTPLTGYPLYLQYPYSSGATTFLAGNFHDIGGRGASPIASGSIAVTRAFMGGGGGAGSNNNNSDDNSYNAYGSSGGPGGGIILMRVAQTSGAAATLHADGMTGLDPANDGGGGGGGGGTIIITSPGVFSGINATADGAAGTTAEAAGGDASIQHGPGGGGGGGIIISSNPLASTAVTAGAAGFTTVNIEAYGATAGSSGVVSGSVSTSSVPGVQSGAECYSSPGTTLLTGPYDSTDGTYSGAAETGSFDGVVTVTNNNDYTAVSVPTATTITNTGTVPGSPIGNTVTPAASPRPQIVNEMYYNNAGARRQVTITDTAPSGWTVQLCGGTTALPNCATATVACNGTNDGWITGGGIDAATAATATAKYCVAAGNTDKVPYWALYTPPASLTAYQRYDASISAQDNAGTPNVNYTHNELYPGWVPITKTVSIISNGCPVGVLPTYPALGVCPGGYLLYTIDYRSVVAGPGTGATDPAAAMLATSAGSLYVTDDGSLSAVSQNTIPNWGTFSKGIAYTLTNNLGVNNALCSAAHVVDCGDSTANTTFTYYTTTVPAGCTGGVAFVTNTDTGWCARVGGAAFQLYPMGFSGKVGQGTLTFAVLVK